MVRAGQGRHFTRFVSALASAVLALALLSGSGIAHAAAKKGKAKSKSSSRAATPAATEAAPASSGTEASPSEPAVTEAAEKAAPAPVADPFPDGRIASTAAASPAPAAAAAAARKPAPADDEAAPSDDAPSSGSGIVERLPASAFPQPYTRGLFGGSLWLTMHGQQWPYYPRTGIGVSGYVWLDNGYAKTRIGDAAQPDHLTKYIQEGRAVLRVTPTYSAGDWFVQAQAELVGTKDQSRAGVGVAAAGTDDMWVRAGSWNKFDVTVGRFEAFEVYHLGMGLDLNTFERQGAVDTHGVVDANGAPLVPQFYGATYAFYRPSGPGNIALHAYLDRSLRFELLGQWGNDGAVNTLGGRPALVFDIGWLKLKGAVEYVKGTSQRPDVTNTFKRRGGAGSAQLVFAPWIELGANFGKGTFDTINDAGAVANNSGDTISYGGFANARPFAFVGGLLLGAGWNYTKMTTLVTDSAGVRSNTTNTQSFLAIQYLAGSQLIIKLVAGYARTSFSPPAGPTQQGFDNDQYSFRLRLQYLF
jgi:hypothetical protein